MVGKYYILNTDGIISEISINSEREVIQFLQKKNEVILDKKNLSNVGLNYKDDNLFLTKDYYDSYLKIKNYIDNIITTNFSPINIISPVVFKRNPQLERLQNLFGLEPFVCSDNLFLRPATDFGVFTLLKNSIIENDSLPKSYYEMGTCYRLEDEFDNTLIRSYSFELPDIHIILGEDNPYSVVNEHLRLYKEILNNLKINFAVSLRITEKEFSTYINEIKDISCNLNRDIFVNTVTSSIRYWESKIKFVNIDKNNKKNQLATVQVDYQSSKIFNFKNDNQEYLTVIHSSPGSIPRLLHSFINSN